MPGNAYLVDEPDRADLRQRWRYGPAGPGRHHPPRNPDRNPAAVQAHRALQAAAAAVPGSRLVDLATTGNRAFVTNDGRTTFGLLYTTPETSFGGPDPSAALSRALAASVPAGWSTGVTGSTLLANGRRPRSGEPASWRGLIGGIGALVILALVFGSFLALLPLIIGVVSVLAAFLAVGALEQVVRGQPDRRVRHRPDWPGHRDRLLPARRHPLA